ncbi:MAG: hypothetical protein AB7O43_10080 [Hyphomicrobiaceae bacterium]
MTTFNGDIVIPYGSASVRGEITARLAEGQTDELEKPGAPVAVISGVRHSEPLRISSLAHPFTRPPMAQELAHAGTQLAFLEQHVLGLCDPWAKPARLFVQRYFGGLRAYTAAEHDSLSSKAQGLSGLVEPEHWCFSGLMPLPRAHLFCPASETSPSIAAESVSLVDFAFWTGCELVAVVLVSGTILPGRRRTLDRIGADNVRLSLIEANILDRDDGPMLLATLGQPFLDAIRNADFPDSPFRGQNIAYPVGG